MGEPVRPSIPIDNKVIFWLPGRYLPHRSKAAIGNMAVKNCFAREFKYLYHDFILPHNQSNQLVIFPNRYGYPPLTIVKPCDIPALALVCNCT